MGCGEDKLMAQQVQETVHKIRKEGRELPWPGATVLQYHNLQKDNFGIGSKLNKLNALFYLTMQLHV